MTRIGTPFNLKVAMGLYIIVIVFFILLALEHFFPLRRRNQRRTRRWLTNGIMSIMTYGAALAIVRPAMSWARQDEFMSFQLAEILSGSAALQAMGVFLLLDLTFYYWHRLNHEWSFLWRFHKVHHVDPDLDVTTGFRFHFVEVALSAGFRALQVLIIGGPVTIYMIYEATFQIATFFHHSNVRLPMSLERVVNRLWVTPRMHGFHHSQELSQTHSNYSVVFSFWDRLHATFSGAGEQDLLRIGILGYERPEDNQVNSLLMMPFAEEKASSPS